MVSRSNSTTESRSPRSPLPIIRIQFGNLLYNTLSRDLYDLKGRKEGLEFPERDEVMARVDKYTEAWQENEEQVLRSMTEVLELDFFQNVIDAYVAPFMPVLSDPIIIHTRREPDSFVDALAHELLHRLLDDNRQDIPYGPILHELFPDEKQMARNHIILFAVLKYLFLDVLKEPHRLERMVRFHQDSSPYQRAWRVVDARGYRELIDQFRSHYALRGTPDPH